jgi:serine protease Do
MTVRNRSPLLVVGSLTTGVLIGMLIGRGGTFVAAQVPHGAVRASATTAAEPAAKGASQDAVYEQLARQYEQFQHVNRTFELVARAVSPSVVHIVAQKSTRNDESPRVRHYEETGSGVIVRGERGRNLFVLTNNHVIEGSSPSKVSIFLKDGQSVHPARFWLDPKADIAVLDLNRDDLPSARLGNSDELEVGTWVVALGSPFGLTHSVSQGIISARGRHMDELQDVENQDFLQTDAAINPGNSGGPLVNMKGEVVGINNSIASNGGGNEGVGFSIPINLARWIMKELVDHGRVSRGALGIDLHPEFRPEDAVALGLQRPQGAWVDVVHHLSPAAEGGLRDGDVILLFNRVEVRDLNHLINLVSMAPIGQPAEVIVWRNGQRLAMTVKVGNRDRTLAMAAPSAERTSARGLLRRPDRPAATSHFALGLELTTLDEAAMRQYQLPQNLRGAVVTKVQPESPLVSLFQPLDVISSVDGRAVQTAEDAANAINRRPGENPLLIGFDRVVKGVIERRTIRVP